LPALVVNADQKTYLCSAFLKVSADVSKGFPIGASETLFSVPGHGSGLFP